MMFPKEKIVTAACSQPSARLRYVPYAKSHVPRYHQWMSDPENLENTSSECFPSIEEQYQCQARWERDPEMISIIAEDIYDNTMVGDLNATLCPVEEFQHPSLSADLVIELQVMIGDSQNRRKGFAKESLEHLISHVGMHCFNALEAVLNGQEISCIAIAKILESNDASIGLFKSLNFKFLRKIEVFQECWYYRHLFGPNI